MPINCPLCHNPIDFDKKKIGWFKTDEAEWSVMTEKQKKKFSPIIGTPVMIHVDCGMELTEKANDSLSQTNNSLHRKKTEVEKD